MPVVEAVIAGVGAATGTPEAATGKLGSAWRRCLCRCAASTEPERQDHYC